MAQGSVRLSTVLLVLSAVLWSVLCVELPKRVSVSGSKGRMLSINANNFYPEHCTSPSGQQGYPTCLIVLSTEPRHGDLFADRVSGTELHVSGTGNTDSSSCKSNRWVYAEETYVDRNPSEASSNNEDYSWSEGDDNSQERRQGHVQGTDDDGSLAKYRGGREFDAFDVQLFSPADSDTPLVNTTVVINMINHRPVAVSSTMVLRARDPWTRVSNDTKTFAFPRYVMLQGFDPDTSDQNPDELLSVCNISFVDVEPDYLRLNFTDGSATPLAGDEAYRDENLAYLSVGGLGTQSASFAIRFAHKDVEGAVSVDAAKTYVTVVPSQDSLLPDARMRSASLPSFAVLRAFGVPTLVLCKYLHEGNSVSDCHFRLLGGDHLSLQVSMSAVQPHGDTDDSFLPDVRSLINASVVLGSDVDTEGSFRLGRYDEGSAQQQDGAAYYPSDPETVAVNPLFSAKFVLSDITTNSPPDVITTSFKTVIQERSGSMATDTSTTNTVTSSEVPVKLYSQYVPTPPLVCTNVTFSWTDAYVEPPTSCGHSSEYDTECTALLGKPDEVQQVALLPAFQVFFKNPALQEYVWLKDQEAVFAVVGITEDSDSGSPLGCMYHRLLFRAVVVGDILESEADLMWMPFIRGTSSSTNSPPGASGSVPACEVAHRFITLRLVVGGQSACQFTVSAPVGSSPSTEKQYLHRAVVLQVPFDSSVLSQNDDYYGGGAVVIPFSVHRAVDKLAALDRASLDASNAYRVLTLIPNAAQQAVMTSYSNGPVTYPSTVITAQTQLFVPRRPFGFDAPPDLDGQEIGATSSKAWLCDFRRSFAAVVTAGNDALVHRHRRVTFYANPLPAAAATAPRQYLHNLVYVHLLRDRSSPLSISRAAAQCSYAEDVGGLRDAASAFGFSLAHTLGVTLDRSLPAKALIERGPLQAAMRRGVAEVYDLEVSAYTPTTVWFSSFDDDAGQQRLAVTRFPKLVKVSASYAGRDQAPSYLSALTDVVNGQFADSFADVDGCAALRLTVTASPEVIQATPGESPNFADDLLGVVFTDGVSTSHEVILVLHIHKELTPSSGNPGEFAADAAAVTSLDRLILVLSLGCLFTAIVVYRRELRRLFRRPDTATDDSEGPGHHPQQHRRTSTEANGISGWATAVASRAKALWGTNPRKFALVPTTVGGEEDEEEMEHGSARSPPRRPPLATTAVVRVAADNGGDEFDEEACKPHPSVVTIASPPVPLSHHSSPPAEKPVPAVVAHGPLAQPSTLPIADSMPLVKPPEVPQRKSAPRKHQGKKD